MTVSIANTSNLRIPELIRLKGLPDVVSDSDLTALIDGSADRRYGLVKRALARGDLIQIRRGLYVLGALHRRDKIPLHALAQRIYGPSYISFESALSVWGLIPEAVYTVTSGCSERSREFDTPLGRFAYTRIPFDPLLTGVVRRQEGNSTFLLANPLRALADYVYASSGPAWDLRSLEESLRLEEIPRVERESFERLYDFYARSQVRAFLDDYARRMYA